jgi:hypothetical protein
MFDPVRWSHEEVVTRLLEESRSIDPRDVARAFLSSLATRRLGRRSALGAYAVFRKFEYHPVQLLSGYYAQTCAVCRWSLMPDEDQDLNILNFERLKWGGVRHCNPIYALLDLRQFGKDKDYDHEAEGREILKVILDRAQSMPGTSKPRDLERALQTILKSNKAEREMLLTILSYCGLLQPRRRPAFWKEYVSPSKHTIPPVHKIDWNDPIAWWRGEDGVNDEACRFWFPELL